MSGWRLVMSSLLHGSELEPVLFNIYLYQLHKQTSATLQMTKLRGADDTPERWDTIPKDLDNLKNWAHGNLFRFNKTKWSWKVLHLGWGNS